MSVDSGRAAGVALAVLGGSCLALQSRINGELGHQLGDGIAAATVSFGVGLIVMLLALPWMHRNTRRILHALRSGQLRWWQCIGGACGAFLVTTQGLTVPWLGVSIFIVALVAGQSVSSLAMDRLGVGPGAPRLITPNRAVGALLCIVAVVIAVGDSFGDPRSLGLAALPLLAGIGVAWQQGVNGRVALAATSPWPATLLNFAVGTVALLVALGIATAVRGGGPPGAFPAEPWLYVGGPLGIVFIAISAAVVHRIGVLLLGLGMIAGQVLGALAIDAVLPGPAGRPDLLTLTGAALTLVAVRIAARG
ncbi:DMT family transporter [Catellatospora citrea]|uniref:Membrane protein n=1 Tax=Catellatospora citrea TaxID=53366 RepID=A0A8J3K650_9ACTN|nr:DMT family transporter [Catellatospora citrea]RKE09443.1 transporter family-2 protein [Catellatospora citrea]GIF97401.1 membrane protein [Catellatospora citrea]